jgi:conjugal transfer ATP-binding protein TraC
MQVMASRGGEKIHLNPFDTDQNAHLAVLAPAGSGKSFYVQNLISSFFAQHHDGYVFVIDKKTSYEVLARLVGEEGCSKVIRPPANYCNPFDLGDSDEALTGLVSLLVTACSLADPQTTLRLEEKALLADAIRLAFAAKRQDASLEVIEGVLTPRQGGKVSSPALSDVMAQIAPAAARASLSEDLVLSLSKKLVPFCRGQLYGGLFDREVSEQETPPVTATRHGPSMFLYDLDGVAADPICRVITAQITLLEILAEIRKPQNRSRPGLLVVEEAGVLGSENPELVEFIRDAWKTFRKLGISCVGISNEVDDFQKPGGPAVMWQVSTHKLVLKLDSTELEKARTGSPKDGLAPLIRDEGALRIMESLKVLKGVYSQGVWMSPDRCGSFVFFPTAFDVCCGASKPAEVEQMRRMARKYGSYKEALFRLCGCAQKTTEGEMKCAWPS